MKLYYILPTLILLSSNIFSSSESREYKYIDLKNLGQYTGTIIMAGETNKIGYMYDWLKDNANHSLLKPEPSATAEQETTRKKHIEKSTVSSAQDDSDTGSTIPHDEETLFYSCVTFEDESDLQEKLAERQEAVMKKALQSRFFTAWQNFQMLKKQEREQLAKQHYFQKQQKKCFHQWQQKQRNLRLTQKKHQSIISIQQTLRAKRAQKIRRTRETNQQLKTFLVLIQAHARYQRAVQRCHLKTEWVNDFDEVDTRPSEQARNALWATRNLTGSTQVGLIAQNVVETCEDMVDRASKAPTNAYLWLRSRVAK